MRLLIISAVSLILLGVVANAEPIKIGALLDLSKEYAMESGAFREGIELAVAQLNQAGGIKGRPLSVVFEDTQYDMKNVRTAARKLIVLDRVSAAVIGTFTEVMVAGPVFEAAKIPLINIWDSAPEIEGLGEYVFGIGVWTPSSSSEAVRFARERLGAKTAVTVCNNGEWSLGVAKAFQDKFEQSGGQVLKSFEMNPAESDFRTVLLRVKALNPDVLYAPVTDNIAAFWMQLKRSGFNRPVITSDVLNQELVGTIGDAAQGVYQTQSTDPQFPETKKMLAAFRQHFDRDCSQVFFTSLGFDSIVLLAEAMKKKGLSGEAIKNGLYEMVDFPGSSGPISMTPEGSVRRMVNVVQIQKGQFVPVS